MIGNACRNVEIVFEEEWHTAKEADASTQRFLASLLENAFRHSTQVRLGSLEMIDCGLHDLGCGYLLAPNQVCKSGRIKGGVLTDRRQCCQSLGQRASTGPQLG